MIRALVLIALFSSGSFAASSLTFGSASTDRINCGSAASIDGASSFTVTAWVYQTTQDTSGQQIVTKYRGATAEGWSWYMNADVGLSDEMRFDFERVTTDMNYETNNANMTTNKWYFVALVMERTTNTVLMYLGDQTTPATALTYGTATNGTGNFNTDANRSLFIGNRDAATPNAAYKGQISHVQYYYNVMLSQAQLQEIQYSSVPQAGASGVWNIGFNGTGTQYDLTGNANNGTATGASVSSNGAPLQFVQGAL